MEIIIIDKDSSVQFQESMMFRLQVLLADLECYYPFFSKWLEKVFFELHNSYSRKVLLCVGSNIFDILGVAIVKDTKEEKKICTLRVVKRYQRQGIGSALLAKTIEVLQDSHPLITVSGVQMDSFGRFLKKRGFAVRDKVKSLYRKGSYEYFFNKPYEHQAALMSIKPEYASAIERGDKLIEFRKQPFSHTVMKVYVYSSHPIKRIIGWFSVDEVICDTPEQLWERYAKIGCIEKNKYDEYYNGRYKAYGILLKTFERFSPYKNPVEFDSSFRAPQSFSYLDNVEFLEWLNTK